jgi:hypothetical protein
MHIDEVRQRRALEFVDRISNCMSVNDTSGIEDELHGAATMFNAHEYDIIVHATGIEYYNGMKHD